MDILRQDLRHALRAFRRQPGSTSLIVITLASGIGINAAVFTLVHSVLLSPLPYEDPNRLVMLWTEVPERRITEATSAYANIRDWKTQTHVFRDVATYDPTSLTFTGGEWAEQVSAAWASANLFPLLGVSPALGRTFSAEEEQQQAPVVVVSHEFWGSRLGADPDVIGHTITIAGAAYQVVGVMPEGFGFPERSTQLWLPQTLLPGWTASAEQRGPGNWRVVARLRRGVELDDAAAAMRVLAERLETMHPLANAGVGINIVPLHEQITGSSFRLALWALFAAVGMVLLIACANAVHLILARGLDRGQELALRQALGATRPRLIRQAVTENTVLALVAGILGVLLAHAFLRVLLITAPSNLPRLHEVEISSVVLAYAALVSLTVGIVFGLVPAARTGHANLFGSMRAGPGATQASGYRARSLLIVLQFAMTMILAFGANLLIRSLIEVQRLDAGFTGDKVLIANLSVAAAERRQTFYAQALEEVRSVPGVRAVGLIEDLFISGVPNRAVSLEGSAQDVSTLEQIRVDAISGDLFETVGVEIREGRGFSDADGADAAPVAIINETMARRFWPGESAIGKRFGTGRPDVRTAWIEVVGVVGDMRRQGLEREPVAQVFRPFAQEPSRNMNLLVRSDLPAATITTTIRARLASIDRSVPLYHISSVEQMLDSYLVQRRFQTFLLGLFSTVALILAAIGIYGLMQHSVARRTHELGVRIALGASPGRLAVMIVGQALHLALPGLAAGMLCALWLSDGLSALVFGVSATDPVNILLPAAALLFTGLAASYFPVRRAAGLDAVTALRAR